ncbi:MAG: hypothetical protein CM15mP85_30080 [Rhodobacterales bacterium]|nr:MAG: hypothetical protein CM15mP85_30080 [Rhodobacterales bacterium]
MHTLIKIVSQAGSIPGSIKSQLHGLPIAVKDMIDTIDMPTQHNSPIYRGHQPSKDAAIVSILKSLGGIISGKLTLMSLLLAESYLPRQILTIKPILLVAHQVVLLQLLHPDNNAFYWNSNWWICTEASQLLWHLWNETNVWIC